MPLVIVIITEELVMAEWVVAIEISIQIWDSEQLWVRDATFCTSVCLQIEMKKQTKKKKKSMCFIDFKSSI